MPQCQFADDSDIMNLLIKYIAKFDTLHQSH